MSHKISVIIPTFNAVGYLAECLLSVSSQVISERDKTVEILIGIDNDPEAEIFLKDFRPQIPNSRVFFFKEHLGPYIIRNTLATLSNADVLVFFDSDDIMPPGFIQAMIKPFYDHQIIRFGYTDFIDIKRPDGNTERVFQKKKISRFEKSVVKRQVITEKGENSLKKKIFALHKSKYLKFGRYINFLAELFVQRKSGVFGIKKSVFLQMGGYKPWPVEADLEFIARAQLNKISTYPLPANFNFFRRIHLNNLTSNCRLGMQSKTRHYYQQQKKTSIYENHALATSVRYMEIL